MALYHRRSGLTHLIAEPVPEILAALSENPLTVAQLADWLAADYGLVADGDALAVLTERLAELESIGLVWHHAA